MKILLLVIVFTFKGSFVELVSEDDPTPVYYILRHELLWMYDKNIIPMNNSVNNLIDVSVVLQFNRLISVDTKMSKVTLESFALLKWTDDFLKWNPAHFSNIEWINFNQDEIWTPMLIIPEVDDHRDDNNLNRDMRIKSNGQVSWLKSFLFTIRCSVNLINYPFDEIKCSFNIPSDLSSDSNGINFIPNPDWSQIIINFAHSAHPEWTINLDHAVWDNASIAFNGSLDDSFNYIHVKINLKRKLSAYSYILIIPYISMNLIMLFALLLPFGSPKRTLLGVLAIFTDCSLISLLAYQLGLDANHATPYAVKCLSINMAMIEIFLVYNTIGSQYIMKRSSEVPFWVKSLIKNNAVQNYLLIRLSSKKLSDLNTEMVKLKKNNLSTYSIPCCQKNNDWILLTTILDRIYFVIYIIVFVVYHS